ncbi:recombinase family protein [Streptomyces specialis]|uniref:recombinase family protein n=1 Tax=Streptomyces specialis TaxID=498367 RepID=UPI00099E8FD5|nr:recombinase family protein [Streptomyces specialis]
MVREDSAALSALGLAAEDLVALGLDRPASGVPEKLVDAYIRRSKKREDLATLRAHLRDVARWARNEELEIRHVWFEQLSASKAHVRRDEFEKAKEAVLAGRSRTLAVWKTDRLDRRGMGVVGSLLDELDRRRSRLVSVSEGLDSSRGGRIVFAFLSERARDEAKDIALRVKIGLDAHRVLGRAPGGRPPFGVTHLGDGQVGPDPGEYPTARPIAEALLRGHAGTTIAHRITAEGARTRNGRHWSANAISRMANSPLWAGLVPFRERKTDEFGNPIDKWGWKAEPLIGPDGRPVSCGTGVVTVTEWYAIRGLLASRTVRGLKGCHGAKQAGKLLTGILRCPLCRVGMVSGGLTYRCRTRMEGGPAACPGIRTKADRADQAVSGAWIRRVSALEPDDPVLHEIARRWLRYQDPETDERRRHVVAALDETERRARDLDDAYYVHGRMNPKRYAALSAALAEQTQALNAELAELQHHSDLTPLLDGVLLSEAWDEATLQDRRMLLRCALDHVTLLPSTGQGDRTPILHRLDFHWIEAAPGRTLLIPHSPGMALAS